jgi:hypothetical protein
LSHSDIENLFFLHNLNIPSIFLYDVPVFVIFFLILTEYFLPSFCHVTSKPTNTITTSGTCLIATVKCILLLIVLCFYNKKVKQNLSPQQAVEAYRVVRC